MKKIFLTLFLILTIIGSSSQAVLAHNGVIDATDHVAKFRDSEYGRIDFITSSGPGTTVQITDSAVTGNAWGEDVGWIILNPVGGGVTNTTSGELGGYAWGENTGWISFSCENENDCSGGAGDWGVNISNHEFIGDAWSENFGWIQFDCGVSDACVKTDWKHTSGGGPTDLCDNIPGIQTTSWLNANQYVSITINGVPNQCIPYTDDDAQCSDGYDNDGDGQIDYPADPGCSDANDNNEFNGGAGTLFECNDGVDNSDTEDTLIDAADPGCHANFDLNAPYIPTRDNEWNPIVPIYVECNDGHDNSDPEDTLSDAADPGCHTDGIASNMSSYNQYDQSEVDVPVPPDDVCPNIPGIQITVPTNLILLNGQCVDPQNIDLCPNILGDQATIPEGKEIVNGQCVDIVEDLCPNISGNQEIIPEGYELDDNGECIPIAGYDACSNIAGNQQTIPDGYHAGQNGQCVPNQPDDCLLPDGVDPNVWNTITCTIEETIEQTEDVIDDTIDKIKTVLGNPAGNPLTKTIAIVGLGVGALFTLLPYLFGTSLSFTEIILIPYRLWSLILAVLGLRKRVRPWGTVYDSVTKQPLDPVIVDLITDQGVHVETGITDMDGRYGFLVSPGRYFVRAKKTHYSFPSIRLAGKTRDEIYLDLYFGNLFEVNESGEVITKNIPMDPENFDWNEFAKRDQKLMKFYSKRDIWLNRIADSLFTIGFAVSVIAAISAPILYNLVILGLYIIMLIIRETGLKQRVFGRILDKNGVPYSFAVVRVYTADGSLEVSRRVANKYGKYYCLIQNGHYIVTIEKKNPDESYTLIHKSEVFEVKHGVINKHFKI